jgi:hypothetical protein
MALRKKWIPAWSSQSHQIAVIIHYSYTCRSSMEILGGFARIIQSSCASLKRKIKEGRSAHLEALVHTWNPSYSGRDSRLAL